MKFLTVLFVILFATGLSFGADAFDAFDDQTPEKNVLHSIDDAVQEKVKSTQDDINVISESDDDGENISQNRLNDDAFDFSPDPNLDETRDL